MAAGITQSQFNSLIEGHIQEKPVCTWQSFTLYVIITVGGIVAATLLTNHEYYFAATCVLYTTIGVSCSYQLYLMFRCCHHKTIGKNFAGKPTDQDLIKKIYEYGEGQGGKRALLKKEQAELSHFNRRHHQALAMALDAQKCKMDEVEIVSTIIRPISDNRGRSIRLVATTDFVTPKLKQPFVVSRELASLIDNSTLYFDFSVQMEYTASTHNHCFIDLIALSKKRTEYFVNSPEWIQECNALKVAETPQADEIRDALLYQNYHSLCQIIEGDDKRNHLREKLAKRIVPLMRQAVEQNQTALFFVNATLIPELEKQFKQ